VIEVGDYDDAIDVIKRNNSDPTRVRNCVRLIIASLDSVSVRIIDHIQSRLTDPHISRMETIPVILTVDPSTLEQANSVLTTSTDASLSQNHHHVDLTNAGGHIHSLSSSLEKSVVCGYISSSAFPVNHDSQEDYRRHQKSIKKLAQDIIKKYAFVFAAYSNLRAAEKEFNYPKFYADYDEDDVPTTPPSADPKESASIPERAWKDTKDEVRQSKQTFHAPSLFTATFRIPHANLFRDSFIAFAHCRRTKCQAATREGSKCLERIS